MKMMKKMLTIMLAVVMMCGMLGTNAKAAGTSSIIIDSGGEVGIDMTQRNFNLYRIFDATAVANAGIQYDWITSGETKLFYDFFFEPQEGNPARVTVPANGSTIDAVVRYINTMTTAVDINNFSNELLAYIIKDNGTTILPEYVAPTNIVKTAQQITYQNLPMGYYLIEDKTTGDNVVASVMLTTSSGEAIHLKATKPTIDKFVFAVNGNKLNGEVGVKGASVNVGDKVTYRCSILIPDISTYLKGYFFQFRDQMAPGIELDPNSIEIHVDGTKVEQFLSNHNGRANFVRLPSTYNDFRALLDGNDEQGNPDNHEQQISNLILATLYGPNHNKTATDLLDNSNLESIYTNDLKGGGILFDLYEPHAYPAGKELEVFYTTTVNETILDSFVNTESSSKQNFSVKNTASLYYTTNPLNPSANIGQSTSNAIITSHHFTITKIAATSDGTATATLLPGATYMLYKEKADGSGYEETAMKFVKTTDTNGDSIYEVPSAAQLDPTKNLTVTDKLENNNVATTSNYAYVDIFGIGAGNYKLVEVEAPDGYTIAEKPFYFTIGSTYGPSGYLTHLAFNATTDNTLEKMEGVALDLTNNRIRSTVTNIPSAALPSTGGIGTTLFTIIGILLMGCAATYLVVSRRRSTKN